MSGEEGQKGANWRGLGWRAEPWGGTCAWAALEVDSPAAALLGRPGLP